MNKWIILILFGLLLAFLPIWVLFASVPIYFLLRDINDD